MAQFVAEQRTNPLSLRITDTDDKRLAVALEHEHKDPRAKGLTRTTLGAHVFALGLNAYFGREEVGVERFREVAAALGGNEDKAFAELLRRGLESWQAEHGGKKGGR